MGHWLWHSCSHFSVSGEGLSVSRKFGTQTSMVMVNENALSLQDHDVEKSFIRFLI